MKNILLVVPCYNCATQAERVALSIDDFIMRAKWTHFQIVKVQFIDNQSTDSTFTTLLNLIPKLKNSALFQVEQNSNNLGLGGTQKKALQLLIDGPYDFLAILHGDDQANINDLENLLDFSQANDFATVLGSRFMKKNLLRNYSPLRHQGNLALNFIYSLFLGTKIHDLGSGLNLFAKKDFVKTNDFQNFDNGFTFNMDLLIFLHQNKTSLLFAPIHWKSVDEKSNASSLQVGLKTLYKILLWKLFGRKIWTSGAAPQ